MSEVHELYLNGHQEDVLVVFPNYQWLHHWTRMWRERFGSTVQFPDFVVIPNYLAVRSKFYRHIFVDDVDMSEDGIWSEEFQFIFHMHPTEVIFSSTHSDDRSAHNDYVPKHQTAGVNRHLRKRLQTAAIQAAVAGQIDSKSAMEFAARLDASPSV